MRSLIIATCIAVLIAIGIGGVVGYQLWAEHRAEMAAQESDAAIIKRASDMQHREECARNVRDWESGNRAKLTSEFGESVADVVKTCKWLALVWANQPAP